MPLPDHTSVKARAISTLPLIADPVAVNEAFEHGCQLRSPSCRARKRSHVYSIASAASSLAKSHALDFLRGLDRSRLARSAVSVHDLARDRLERVEPGLRPGGWLAHHAVGALRSL